MPVTQPVDIALRRAARIDLLAPGISGVGADPVDRNDAGARPSASAGRNAREGP